MNLKLHRFCGYFLLGAILVYSEGVIAEDNAHPLQGAISINFEDKIIQLRKNYSIGKYQDVADLSKKLLLLDSSNEEVKDLYALASYKLKNYKSIIELFSERQAEYVDSTLQLKLRSIALTKEKSFLSAMTTLRTLKSFGPLTPEWKAFYHYLVFKINPSSSFKELERMNKGVPSVANDLTAGKLYLLFGKNDKAIMAFESSLKKDYTNAEALEYLGDCYFKNKKLNQSILFYSTLLNIEPKNAEVKIKLAQIYVNKGQLINGIKILEADNRSEVVELRERLSSFVNNFITNPPSRSIAEEKIKLSEITISENKLILEETFIPKDIDIYVDPRSKSTAKDNSMALQISSVTEPIVNNDIRAVDVSTLELSIGVKAKKYDLTGVGFNANADYSTGMSANIRYTFFPEGRSWNSQIVVDHSRVQISELRGLSPSKTTLSESRLAIGVNHLVGSFSIGPVLMYENMSATQTAPSVIRGNINFFNLGIKSGYSMHVKNNLKLNMEANYLAKIMSVSKTTSVGTAERRSLMEASAKLYYEMRPSAYYFIGLGFLQTDTHYSASSERGTSQAIEKEKEFTFPVGINYAF